MTVWFFIIIFSFLLYNSVFGPIVQNFPISKSHGAYILHDGYIKVSPVILAPKRRKTKFRIKRSDDDGIHRNRVILIKCQIILLNLLGLCSMYGFKTVLISTIF